MGGTTWQSTASLPWHEVGNEKSKFQSGKVLIRWLFINILLGFFAALSSCKPKLPEKLVSDLDTWTMDTATICGIQAATS